MADDETKPAASEAKPNETELTPEAQAAAEQTAREGGTATQAESAAEKEEAKQRPELTESERKALAKDFADELEARGFFEEVEQHANDGGALPPTQEPASDAGSDGSSDNAQPAATEIDERPRKRSWAERFAGLT